MNLVKTQDDVRLLRSSYRKLGFVPTMGALHAGHLSLITQAKAECGSVAVSIFVNPSQFGPNEDFANYPRQFERDLDLLRDMDTDIVFVPDVDNIYSKGFSTQIDPGPMANLLEGAIRPGHFAGVATIVLKLFQIFTPDVAYFGQKDAQQCLIIRKIVSDLSCPVTLRIGATVREPDGLALSSRNIYLSAEERPLAASLYKALTAIDNLYKQGIREAYRLSLAGKNIIARHEALRLDYLTIVDPETLEPLENIQDSALALIALRLGKTRLLDNYYLGVKSDFWP